MRRIGEGICRGLRPTIGAPRPCCPTSPTAPIYSRSRSSRAERQGRPPFASRRCYTVSRPRRRSPSISALPIRLRAKLAPPRPPSAVQPLSIRERSPHGSNSAIKVPEPRTTPAHVSCSVEPLAWIRWMPSRSGISGARWLPAAAGWRDAGFADRWRRRPHPHGAGSMQGMVCASPASGWPRGAPMTGRQR